jgi:hypothetical protein
MFHFVKLSMKKKEEDYNNASGGPLLNGNSAK